MSELGFKYQSRLHDIEAEFQNTPAAHFEELRNRAKTRNIAMLQTPTGFAFAIALDGNGSARVAVLRTESSRVEALVDTIRKSGSRTIVIPSTALTRYRDLAVLLDQKDLSIFLVK